MSNKFFIASIGVAIYLASIIFRNESSTTLKVYGISNTIVQTGLAAWCAVLANNAKHSTNLSSVSSGYFKYVFILLALGDCAYGILLNIMMVPDLNGTYRELYYNSFYALYWSLGAFVFLSDFRKLNSTLRVFFVGLSAVFITIVMGSLVPSILINRLPTEIKVVHLICTLGKSLILSMATLHLIFARAPWLRMFSSGYLVTISYSILLEYLEIHQILTPGLPTEIFWTTGTALCGIGLLSLNRLNKLQSRANNEHDFHSLESLLLVYSFGLIASITVGWIVLTQMWPDIIKLPKLVTLSSWSILSILSLVVWAQRVQAKIIKPFNSISEAVKSSQQQKIGITELDIIQEELLSITRSLEKESKLNAEMLKIAAQTSHDIRSPLAALRMLTNQAEDLPEDTRHLISQVTARIHTIADQLLVQRRGYTKPIKTNQEETNPKACAFVYPILETILAEKRITQQNSSLRFEMSVIGNMHSSIAAISAEQLGRIISNILDNSIDAFSRNTDIQNPRISVFLSMSQNADIQISVQDNAGGMSEEISAKIEAGVGVSSTSTGNGLGLSHARETLITHGGKFDFITQLGFGSVVTLQIKSAPTPKWLQSQIKLNFSEAVVLDDDPSIHSVWRWKLQNRANVKEFRTQKSFNEYLHNNNDGAHRVYLIDMDLRSEEANGIDILLKLPRNNSYLVSSRYDEAEVQRQLDLYGIKVIPKFLAPFIEIEETEHAQ